jgi:hypothetical protein
MTDQIKLKISDHSRYRLVSRSDKNRIGEKSIDLIFKKACKSENKVYPVFGALHLMCNNYEVADYYQYMGLIFVVANNTVKTVYEYKKQRWKKR